MLPTQFAFLANEPGPVVLREALKDLGLHEVPGPGNSPRILEMARQVGADSYYKQDATPWCALAMSAWVKAAGFKLPYDPLAALNWAKFGNPVAPGEASLGDILVKARVGGGHVTLYVGETATHYACLGGNQANSVCIAWFPKASFSAIRRCPWKVAQPANVRPIKFNKAGVYVPVSEA
jgi:uncharacterized protein (TIGR02594 family)